MNDKRVKLLFNDSFNQCLHCHSIYSYEVDGEGDLDVCDVLELVRQESNRVKTFDLMQSKFPLTLVAITDHNDMRAYFGESGKDIQSRLHKDYLSADDLREYYGINKDERLRMEVIERFKVITGAEISAKLGDIKVHTLALDFDERIFGLFRYTKEKYRFNRNGRAKIGTVGMAVHLSKGKFVLAHPSRYVKDGKISLNDILEAAYKAKCFDGIECATSNTTIDDRANSRAGQGTSAAKAPALPSV